MTRATTRQGASENGSCGVDEVPAALIDAQLGVASSRQPTATSKAGAAEPIHCPSEATPESAESPDSHRQIPPNKNSPVSHPERDPDPPFTREFYNYLCNFAAKIIKQKFGGFADREAMDFVHEAVVRFYSNIRKWNPEKVDFPGYMFASVRNLIFHHHENAYNQKRFYIEIDDTTFGGLEHDTPEASFYFSEVSRLFQGCSSNSDCPLHELWELWRKQGRIDAKSVSKHFNIRIRKARRWVTDLRDSLLDLDPDQQLQCPLGRSCRRKLPPNAWDKILSPTNI